MRKKRKKQKPSTRDQHHHHHPQLYTHISRIGRCAIALRIIVALTYLQIYYFSIVILAFAMSSSTMDYMSRQTMCESMRNCEFYSNPFVDRKRCDSYSFGLHDEIGWIISRFLSILHQIELYRTKLCDNRIASAAAAAAAATATCMK